MKKSLTLVAEAHAVRVLDGDIELARHDRSYDRGKVIEAPEHIAALARDKRRAHELRGRDRLRSVCLLDRAIAEALTRGAPSAASVAHLLDQRVRARHALPPLDTVLPDDPRVRDLRVTPHALARYDELYAAPATEDAPSPAATGDDQEGSS